MLKLIDLCKIEICKILFIAFCFVTSRLLFF